MIASALLVGLVACVGEPDASSSTDRDSDQGGGVVIESGTAEQVAAAGDLSGQEGSISVLDLKNDAVAEVLRQDRRHRYPDPLTDLELRHGIAPQLVERGELTTDSLGIELTLSLDRHWVIQESRPGWLVFAPPSNPLGALRPVIVFQRPVGFFDAEQAPKEEVIPGDQSMPADALEEWIESLPQVELQRRLELEIDGRTVRRYDVDLVPAKGPINPECRPVGCLNMMWSGGSDWIVLRGGERLRYYEIDDEQGPIVVIAIAIATAGDPSFHDLADRFIRTARLGPSHPHPLPDGTIWSSWVRMPAGTYLAAGVPGLQLTFSRDRVVDQQAGSVTVGDHIWKGTRGLVGELVGTPEGPIATVEEAVAALLNDPDWETADLGTIELADHVGTVHQARLVSVVSVERDGHRRERTPPLVTAPLEVGDDPRLAGWPTMPGVLIGVIELDDGRLFGLGASVRSSEEPEDLTDELIEWVATIQFVE